MILLPDTEQASVYEAEIAPAPRRQGDALFFAHGFNIRFGQIVPPAGVDVAMVAPKGPGHLVRRTYTEGGGVPSLVAVAQDASGKAHDLALSYAHAHRRHPGRRARHHLRRGDRDRPLRRAGRAVRRADRPGPGRVRDAGRAPGYQPESAYFECLHELKLIVDLMYEQGIAGMRYSISDTAEYGDLTRGPRVINDARPGRDAARSSTRSRTAPSPRSGSPRTGPAGPTSRPLRAGRRRPPHREGGGRAARHDALHHRRQAEDPGRLRRLSSR